VKNKPEDIAKVFNTHAESYVDRYFNVEYYAVALELFYSKAKANGSYLDIACGPGNLTHHLTQFFPEAGVLGIDIAEDMLAIARTMNPNAKFKNLSCSDIGTLQQKFNGILCGFVLPYLSKTEVKSLISNCANLLKTKGLLFLSGNKGIYEESKKQGASTGKGPKLYSFLYSQEFLEQELAKGKFKILKSFNLIRKYEGFNANEIIIVAAKA
jgi:2-polyprenyl-3-methyl-5-hydroxy-6-metoxy-1,4-benzoquinol methylase